MRRRFTVAVLTAVLASCAGIAAHIAAAERSCAAIAKLRLPATTIVSADEVSGPSFSPPNAAAQAGLPAFCRITATTAPAINFEVWLPTASWNGKFQGVGNGGMAGTISYGAMAAALKRGYAVASTDTGHVSKGSFDASWALGRSGPDRGLRSSRAAPDDGERQEDYRDVLRQAPLSTSYYVGCSKGGQQGLMEAQRYPDDYDGIIAGDPANNWTRFYAGGHLWYWLSTTKDPARYIPASKSRC